MSQRLYAGGDRGIFRMDVNDEAPLSLGSLPREVTHVAPHPTVNSCLVVAGRDEYLSKTFQIYDVSRPDSPLHSRLSPSLFPSVRASPSDFVRCILALPSEQAILFSTSHGNLHLLDTRLLKISRTFPPVPFLSKHGASFHVPTCLSSHRVGLGPCSVVAGTDSGGTLVLDLRRRDGHISIGTGHCLNRSTSNSVNFVLSSMTSSSKTVVVGTGDSFLKVFSNGSFSTVNFDRQDFATTTGKEWTIPDEAITELKCSVLPTSTSVTAGGLVGTKGVVLDVTPNSGVLRESLPALTFTHISMNYEIEQEEEEGEGPEKDLISIEVVEDSNLSADNDEIEGADQPSSTVAGFSFYLLPHEHPAELSNEVCRTLSDALTGSPGAISFELFGPCLVAHASLSVSEDHIRSFLDSSIRGKAGSWETRPFSCNPPVN